MPRVETVNGIALCIYFGDHNPPHFHARTSGREARIVLSGLSTLTNTLTSSELRTVLEWASNTDNRAKLQAAWDACNP